VAVDPLKAIEVVCVADGNVDDAIDLEKSDLDRYRETRDPRHIAFKPGMQPTKFVLRPLKLMFTVDHIEHLPAGAKASLAFMVACHEVRLPNGERLRPEKTTTNGVYSVEIAGEEWIESVAMHCRLKSIYEMGLFAIRRASLKQGELGPFDWPAGPAATD
jgi:hypothetical protein